MVKDNKFIANLDIHLQALYDKSMLKKRYYELLSCVTQQDDDRMPSQPEKKMSKFNQQHTGLKILDMINVDICLKGNVSIQSVNRCLCHINVFFQCFR